MAISQTSPTETDETSEAQLESTASFRAVIEELENSGLPRQDQGRRFEKLVLQYFRKDPYWSEIFSEVKLWADWEDKPQGWPDLGVDIVGKFAEGVEGESDWAAIQCKFYDRSRKLSHKDLAGFLAASERSRQRILISTADLNRNAAKLAGEVDPHLTCLTEGQLAQAKFRWATLKEQIEATRYVGKVFSPRADQLEAILSVLEAFWGVGAETLPPEWLETLAESGQDFVSDNSDVDVETASSGSVGRAGDAGNSGDGDKKISVAGDPPPIW